MNDVEISVGKAVGIGVATLIAVILILGSFYIIPAGYRGVELTFGKPSPDAVGEGLHFKIPIAQSVKKLEVRTQKIETSANAASKDLQDVETVIALNFHLSPGEVPVLYQEIGLAYVERIISPSIQEAVKAVQARFTAEELVTKRAEVRNGIKDALSEKLAPYYITVDDFNIVDFQFSEEFDNSIEQKVVSEQLKLKAEIDLQRIEIEAKQIIARAEAEATSLTLKNAAIKNNPDVVNLMKIEANLAAIEAWKSGAVLPVVTGGAMPFLNIDSLTSSTATQTTTA